MPKATPLVNNFNSGEISPKLDARADITKYASGCITLQNMIPMVEGGTTECPGTYFVVGAKHNEMPSGSIRFFYRADLRFGVRRVLR
jgi:hypothetical protein